MREMFYTVAATIGSVVSYFIGGVDTMFIILCVMLGIDYFSGLIVALVFKKSPKTESGKVNSAVSFKGLCKKFYVVVLVGVAHLLDVVLETNFVRGGVIMVYISNEAISIIENGVLMGIPIPTPLQKALDILTERGEDTNEQG